jgi:hypothetical protein
VIVELGVNFDCYRNTARASVTMLNSTWTNKLETGVPEVECLKSTFDVGYLRDQNDASSRPPPVGSEICGKQFTFAHTSRPLKLDLQNTLALQCRGKRIQRQRT